MKLFIPMVHFHYDDTVPAEDEPKAYLTYEAADKIAVKAARGSGVSAEVLEVEFDGR